MWTNETRLRHDRRGLRYTHDQSWLRKSEQGDKWIFCLTAANVAAYQERK